MIGYVIAATAAAAIFTKAHVDERRRLTSITQRQQAEQTRRETERLMRVSEQRRMVGRT